MREKVSNGEKVLREIKGKERNKERREIPARIYHANNSAFVRTNVAVTWEHSVLYKKEYVIEILSQQKLKIDKNDTQNLQNKNVQKQQQNCQQCIRMIERTYLAE